MRGDLGAAVERLLVPNQAAARASIASCWKPPASPNPAPILQSLLAEPTLQHPALRWTRVVVTVDALTGMATLDTHEVSRRQAALADLLLLTKTDLDDGRTGRCSSIASPRSTPMRTCAAVFGDLDPRR